MKMREKKGLLSKIRMKNSEKEQNSKEKMFERNKKEDENEMVREKEERNTKSVEKMKHKQWRKLM